MQIKIKLSRCTFLTIERIRMGRYKDLGHNSTVAEGVWYIINIKVISVPAARAHI